MPSDNPFPDLPRPHFFLVAAWQQASRPATAAASRPTTAPAGTSRRRAVRAIRSTGGAGTNLVLTKQDVDRLASDPVAAAAMKNGKVVVVVDSVAAGIEGRGPVAEPDSVALSAAATGSGPTLNVRVTWASGPCDRANLAAATHSKIQRRHDTK